jgi:DNA-binding response OmpR family regulator
MHPVEGRLSHGSDLDDGDPNLKAASMPETGTILIVEDDEDISSLLGRGFQSEGYGVDFARTGPEAIERAKANAYHVIILDVMLPGASGIEVARALRQDGRDAPIIMLSARDAVADRIQGLSAGADDYVIKPFAFEELLARVRAQGRRQVTNAEIDGKLTAGDYTLDPKMRIIARAGHQIELTERETALMALLMHHAGRPLSRNEIFEALWEGQGGASINVVDVYIGYLRRKLSIFGSGSRTVIRTVRGLGFVFRP